MMGTRIPLLLLFLLAGSLAHTQAFQCDSILADLTGKFEAAKELLAQESHTQIIDLVDSVKMQYKSHGNCGEEVSRKYGLLCWIEGRSQERLGNYLAAFPPYQEATDIFRDLSEKNPMYASALYQPLANIYTRLGDYEKAEALLLYALEIVRQADAFHRVGDIRGDLAIVYKERDQWSLAIQTYHDVIDSRHTTQHQLALAQINLGTTLCEPRNPLQDPQKGLQLIQEGIANLEAARDEISPQIALSQLAEAHRELAHAHERLHHPDPIAIGSALLHYLQSLDLLTQSDPSQHRREFAKTLVPLAGLERRAGRLEEAMSHIQQALASVLPPGFDPNSEQNPLAAVLYPENAIMEALVEKARILTDRFDSTANRQDLHAALDCHALISVVEDTLQLSYLNNESKWIMAALRHARTEHALVTCLRLWELEGDPAILEIAYDFAERAKSAVLRENMARKEALFHRGPASSLFSEMNEIQRQIRNFGRQGGVVGAQDSILKLQSQYVVLLDSARRNYPSYVHSRFQRTPAPLKEVQASLRLGEQVMIEYFIGEENIVVLVIGGGSIKLQRLEKPEAFEGRISAYRESLVHNSDSLVGHALWLYRSIFAQLDIPVTKRLVVIPDGQLSQVPFHALFSSAPEDRDQFQRYPYLARDFAFSYAYSASIWLHQSQAIPTTSPEVTFSGFAPTAFSNSISSAQTLETTRFLADEWGGTSYIGKEANSENFWDAVGKSAILFIATHAVGRERSSYVLLAGDEGSEMLEDTLHLSDLYLSERPVASELAVFMACETATGRLTPGEGAQSIANGMALAGCPGVVAAQWEAGDMVSASILELAFAQMAEGVPRDLAMQSAYLAYLDNGAMNDTYEAAPVHWAALGVWGSSMPLQVKPRGGNGSLIPILGGLLLLFILMGVCRRKRRLKK